MGRELVFVMQHGKWNVQVLRNADGTAHINRISGPGCKPAAWDCPDRTPEGWVGIQAPNNRKRYVRVS